ncbi:hypothetical protein GCM10010149_47470 [Nonomuraea roseoviolacea subsp. roseoviolacea]|uniref:hypothetical protein n=1 Tax=Nonomuraea roseoviolacea TaxID=103837 RepID=UPI0031E21FF8
MGEQDNTTNPTDDTTTNTEVADKGTEGVDVAALLAERDKWKTMARKHEAGFKDITKKYDQLSQAQMSETEKAIEAAKAEARKQALSEVGTRLTSAELTARAAKAGVTLPDVAYINLAALSGDDGEPNGDAIESFLKTLPKSGKSFDQDVFNKTSGNREASKPRQLTRADLQGMTPEAIQAARLAGQLNDLLGIK